MTCSLMTLLCRSLGRQGPQVVESPTGFSTRFPSQNLLWANSDSGILSQRWRFVYLQMMLANSYQLAPTNSGTFAGTLGDHKRWQQVWASLPPAGPYGRCPGLRGLPHTHHLHPPKTVTGASPRYGLDPRGRFCGWRGQQRGLGPRILPRPGI